MSPDRARDRPAGPASRTLGAVLRVGLTGGIGAGKSTVARVLTESGAHLVDADRIAREVVEPGSAGLARLTETFGDGIIGTDGALDRPALAELAFADDESRAALNAIMHPLIGERTQQRIDQAPEGAIVVQDIPLLVEGGMAPLFDLVLVVDLDAEIRLQRLVEFRGMAESDARSRMAAQATDAQRRAVADVLIDNRGTPEELEAAVHALWRDRLVPFAQARAAGRPARLDPQILPAAPDAQARIDRQQARVAAACAQVPVRVIPVGPGAVPGRKGPQILEFAVAVSDTADRAAAVAQLGAAGYPADQGAAELLAGLPDAPLRPDPAAATVCVGTDPGQSTAIYVLADGDPALTAAETALARAHDAADTR